MTHQTNTNPTRHGDLSDKAVLIGLHIGAWEAIVDDKELSNDVNNREGFVVHGAKTNATKVSKKLFPQGAPSYEALMTAVRELRTYFKEQTLPWEDGGTRIRPAESFLDLAEGIRHRREKIESEFMPKFLQEYPNFQSDAKGVLNGRWKQEDYPSESEIKRRFYIDIRVFALPQEKEDFRIALGATGVAERLQESAKDGFVRLSEALKKMLEKLSDPDANFHGSLFGNLKELCELLPTLNLFHDEKLTKLIEEIQEGVLSHSVQEVKGNKTTRAEVASEVERIQSSMAGIF